MRREQQTTPVDPVGEPARPGAADEDGGERRRRDEREVDRVSTELQDEPGHSDGLDEDSGGGQDLAEEPSAVGRNAKGDDRIAEVETPIRSAHLLDAIAAHRGAGVSGACRDRTGDLRLAKAALSQLS